MRFEADVGARLAAEGGDLVRRLFARDASLWVSGGRERREVVDRLGWLVAPRFMAGRIGELDAFSREIRDAGFARVVLLGMGGSSLAPEVFARSLGARAGHPALVVLDTTDPAAIRAVEGGAPLDRTLFLASSKSGTTIESSALLAYFWHRTGGRAEQFAAITDAGTPLAELASSRGFRRLFLNPHDIGGRFSALSHFGLVPAALIGVDVATVLERASRMVQACGDAERVAENPGATLAAALVTAWAAGRDKLTLVAAAALEPLGPWIEQLVAESTGKGGKGVLPVVGEPVGDPEVYGADRLFVVLGSPDALGAEAQRRLSALEAAGHPVLRLPCAGPADLGAEFVRWEVATALCGAWMRLNPFDQPNVAESKTNTERVLRQLVAGEEPPAPAPADAHALRDALRAVLARVRPGDYVALLAYVEPCAGHDALLEAMRVRLRDGLRVATTVGYGPRYLHSAGQLHKGGSDAGVFLQIVAEDERDIAVPGERYTFGTLKLAQAIGDLLALQARGRRVLRIRLKAAELPQLREELEEAMSDR